MCTWQVEPKKCENALNLTTVWDIGQFNYEKQSCLRHCQIQFGDHPDMNQSWTPQWWFAGSA